MIRWHLTRSAFDIYVIAFALTQHLRQLLTRNHRRALGAYRFDHLTQFQHRVAPSDPGLSALAADRSSGKIVRQTPTLGNCHHG